MIKNDEKFLIARIQGNIHDNIHHHIIITYHHAMIFFKSNFVFFNYSLL